MNFSFRGHQFLAHWIPGCVLLFMLYVCDYHFKFGYYKRFGSLLSTQPSILAPVPNSALLTNTTISITVAVALNGVTLTNSMSSTNMSGLAAGLRAAATRGLARSCRGGHQRGHPHGLQRGRPEPIVQRQQGTQDHQGRLLLRNPSSGVAESPGHLEGVPAAVRRAGVQSTAQSQGPAVLQV